MRNGVVTLTGQPELAAEEDLIPIAVRLAWDVDGVVDVVDKIGAAAIWRRRGESRCRPAQGRRGPAGPPRCAHYLAGQRITPWRGPAALILARPARPGHGLFRNRVRPLKVANTRCRPAVSMPSRRNCGMSAAVFGSATGPKQP